MITYLSLADGLQLIDDLAVGPIRDLGLLDAAFYRPQASVYGRDAYLDLDTKAAVLLESVVRNHALVDGNKRLGWLAMVVFYGLNDVDLDVDDDVAYHLVLGIARSAVDYPAVAAALATWRRAADKDAGD